MKKLIKMLKNLFHVHRKASIIIDYGVDHAGHWYTYKCRCGKHITKSIGDY